MSTMTLPKSYTFRPKFTTSGIYIQKYTQDVSFNAPELVFPLYFFTMGAGSLKENTVGSRAKF